ncbi:MAG: hypothetical protein QF790_08775 [Gammaproteobacteria bacterium]|jgi:hypothetical protein|nr:hypothetical protein [Gammaproteobacteria bacterium]MDP6617241.1 hypothetical protein [Gammaproteobacteria bacterium]
MGELRNVIFKPSRGVGLKVFYGAYGSLEWLIVKSKPNGMV